ncbi:MAG: phosphoribosyltransferase family protein [Candidatus Saccharimonas sp.]
MKRLIDAYKFERVRAAHQALAGLLNETLPQLPADILIVPVPTIMPHVRVRGYAHVELVAKRLADIRGHRYAEVLVRRHNQPQRGALRQERIKRASLAFKSKQLDGQACLLVDDVFTTGSTLEYAARELKAAGASSVWVAVLSRQPLEKT